jgi:hypothetical protein
MSTRPSAALDVVMLAIGSAEAGKQMEKAQIEFSIIKSCFIWFFSFCGRGARSKVK